MRMKDTIRLTKEALKNPWLYSEAELLYMKKARARAKEGIKLQQLKGNHDKSETSSIDSESRGDDGVHSKGFKS